MKKLLFALITLLILPTSAFSATTSEVSGNFIKHNCMLEDGDYIIVYTDNASVSYALKAVVNNSRIGYAKISISSNSISTEDASIIWHITENGSNWVICNEASGQYAASTGEKNKAQLLPDCNDSKSRWNVSGSTCYEFCNIYNSSVNTRANLRYNDGVGFGCYSTSTGGKLTLYKMETNYTPSASVITSEATVLSSTSASVSGTYSNNTSTPTNCGFLYGTSPDQLTEIVYADVNSTFSLCLSGLKVNTTYYLRAFTTVKGTGQYKSQSETFYGQVSSFTTKEIIHEDIPHQTSGWLSFYEIPSCETELKYGASYSSAVKERYGNTDSYIIDTKSPRQKIVIHTFSYNNKLLRTYTMLYDADKKCALWTAFPLHGGEFPKKVSRSKGFTYDNALPQDWQANLSNAYEGYTRGHQVASGYRLTTSESNQQTFYFSNMTPQNSDLNSGVWNDIETNVRDLGLETKGNDTLYVVTGPIFEPGYSYCLDAKSVKCPIPTKYFTCIMLCTFDTEGNVTEARTAAFIVPHKPTAQAEKVSVDYVEEITGFDFFTNVPKEIQKNAEQKSNIYF